MANANAIVEKMATVGLRHGEKAGVAIAMTVFLLCVGMAVSRESINTTPDQVKKAAQLSDQNLNRKEDRDTIIKKLEDTDNIKPTNFAAAVEEQIKVKLVADQFKPLRTWVTPEPGAGLIRDTPDLIAPTDLFAYPGRGGVLIFALDEEGNKIALKEGEEKEKAPQKYGRMKKRRKSGMGGSGMGGMMGARKKKHKKSKVEIEREEREERERLARELKSGLVGEAKDTPKDEEADKEEGGPFKEITKGYRWVAITGTLDHAQMLANYRAALKNPAVAHPQYMRLDLQRRTQQPDGTWSDWQTVDAEKNYDILDNVTDQEEELAPETVLPEGLVDHLPFLTAGLWEKVHIASLVPKERRELPEEPKNKGGQGMMGMGGSNMGSMMAMMQRQASQQNMGVMMPGSMGSMGSAMGMMGGVGLGGGESAGNYWKSEEKKVMIRALDFTVDPDSTYRYRVRIVVANPNYNRDDISPGVDNKKKFLEGPWSKETDVVSMPPDVQPYAVAAQPANARSDTRVRFQVVRFNPGDGWTIPHRFDAGVGEVIGEPYRESVPKSDGSGTTKEEIDFNAHQIVIDVDGGGYQNLPNALTGPSIERPALAALLRPDGAMVVHSQADDIANEFRKDVEANYKHELAESDKKKKREHSQGAGYAGMMGSMMSSMMGGRRGGR